MIPSIPVATFGQKVCGARDEWSGLTCMREAHHTGLKHTAHWDSFEVQWREVGSASVKG